MVRIQAAAAAALGSLIKMQNFRGTWVAQSVKCLTLDLSSSLDLRVMSSSPIWPHAGCGASLKKKKNTDSEAPPQTHWLRICIST